MSCIWYKVTKLWGSSYAGALGNKSTPWYWSQVPGPIWPRVVAPDKVLFVGQIELNHVFMLNWITWNRIVLHLIYEFMLKWIVWNRTVLTFKLRIYVGLTCLKWNCFCMMIWIVWNRTVLGFNLINKYIKISLFKETFFQ